MQLKRRKTNMDMDLYEKIFTKLQKRYDGKPFLGFSELQYEAGLNNPTFKVKHSRFYNRKVWPLNSDVGIRSGGVIMMADACEFLTLLEMKRREERKIKKAAGRRG